MNFGYNTNVRCGETLYHVQTEDRGPGHPCIDTVVYQAGRVVYKRSNNYAEQAGAASPEALPRVLQELLVKQHHEIMASVEEGRIPIAPLPLPPPPAPKPKPVAAPVAAPPAAPKATGERLDVRLTNPKTWLCGGSVTLELEIRGAKSAQPGAGADVEVFLERERERTASVPAKCDEAGRATIRFRMPAASEGAALVIRATAGAASGELRFLLKAKPRNPADTSVPASK